MSYFDMVAKLDQLWRRLEVTLWRVVPSVVRSRALLFAGGATEDAAQSAPFPGQNGGHHNRGDSHHIQCFDVSASGSSSNSNSNNNSSSGKRSVVRPRDVRVQWADEKTAGLHDGHGQRTRAHRDRVGLPPAAAASSTGAKSAAAPPSLSVKHDDDDEYEETEAQKKA